MKAPFLRDAAHSPNFSQTTILCHSVGILLSPESLSFQLTLVATKPPVGCPVGREASLGVFAEKADECDAILAEHIVSPFRAPSVGATGSEWVLLPKARDALLGETFRGNRQSRVMPSRRARGFAPDAEPNRRGQESGHRTARAGSYRSDFKGRTDGSTPTEPVASGLSAAKTHEALYREFRRHSGCRLGKIVRRDGTSAVRLPRSTDGPTRTAHLTETPRRPGADRMIISAKRDRFEKTNHLAVPARSRASMISRNVVQSPWASNSGRRRCR